MWHHVYLCIRRIPHTDVFVRQYIYIYIYIYVYIYIYSSRRRSDWKYLDLQIGQFSCPLLWVTGILVYSVKISVNFWGIPWKLVWKLQGLSENLFEMWAVVIILSQISSARGLCTYERDTSLTKLAWDTMCMYESHESLCIYIYIYMYMHIYIYAYMYFTLNQTNHSHRSLCEALRISSWERQSTHEAWVSESRTPHTNESRPAHTNEMIHERDKALTKLYICDSVGMYERDASLAKLSLWNSVKIWERQITYEPVWHRRYVWERQITHETIYVTP